MKNIYLFYGPDGYRLHQKLDSWVKKFAEKSSVDFDMETIDAETADWEHIQAALMLVPLFGGKRLVIIKNVFSKNKVSVLEKLIEYLPKVGEDLVVVIEWGAEIDARNAGLVWLKENATVHYFAKPDALSMRKLLDAYLKEWNLEMDMPAKGLLMQRIGEDSQAFMTELDKLRSYADDKITADMVNELIPEKIESRIFVLTDAIYSGKSAEAAKLMLNELEVGTAALQILGLLISQIRKVLIIKDCLERGIGQQETQKLSGAAPFLYSKFSTMAKKYSTEKLVMYYLKLTIADSALKTGAEDESAMLELVSI